MMEKIASASRFRDCVHLIGLSIVGNIHVCTYCFLLLYTYRKQQYTSFYKDICTRSLHQQQKYLRKPWRKKEDANVFKRLAKGWELLYDEETQFIRPRDDTGQFLANFDPYEPWRGFQEGNA